MKRPGVRASETFQRLKREVKFQGRVVTVTVDHIVLPNGVEAHHDLPLKSAPAQVCPDHAALGVKPQLGEPPASATAVFRQPRGEQVI